MSTDLNVAEGIKVTALALKHFKDLLQKKPEVVGIRFGVKSAGCSGLSYVLDFAKEKESNDVVFEFDTVKVLVDAKSLPYLTGTEIDCVMEDLNTVLKFKNPRVKSLCGCGESFSIEK